MTTTLYYLDKGSMDAMACCTATHSHRPWTDLEAFIYDHPCFLLGTCCYFGVTVRRTYLELVHVTTSYHLGSQVAYRTILSKQMYFDSLVMPVMASAYYSVPLISLYSCYVDMALFVYCFCLWRATYFCICWTQRVLAPPRYHSKCTSMNFRFPLICR